MKKLLFVALILLVAWAVFAQDNEPAARLDLTKVEITGLVYGPDVATPAAIVSSNNVSSIVYEGRLYWVANDGPWPSISGDRALRRIPESERLSVASINSGGVTMSYQGRTVTKKLKAR